MVDHRNPDVARIQAYIDADRPRRFAAMGYGFSGDFDTIEDAMAMIRSLPADWPCALYERIPMPTDAPSPAPDRGEGE